MEDNVFTVEYILKNELDKKAYGFIYTTENNINEMKYIGQKKFIKGWKYYLGSGVDFKKDIKKYGRKNFIRSIVEIAYSEQELNHLEQQWIVNHNAVESKNYYNIADGGHSNPMAGKSKEEIKRIHKKRCMEVICLNDNGIYSGAVEAGEKLNVPISSITSCCKGKRNSAGETEDGSPRAWMYTKDYNEESAQIILGNAIASKLPKPKQIILKNTGQVFNSATEASKIFEISRGDISACCRNKRNYAGFMKTGEPCLWEFYLGQSCIKEEDIKIEINKCNNLQKAENHPMSKKIICLNNKEVFNYIGDASMKYLISDTNISACCRGETKHAGKINGENAVWMYLEEYDSNIENVELRLKKGIESHGGGSTQIICLTNGELFNSIVEASIKYNIIASCITRCCQGNRKSAGKHPITGEKMVWMYYDKYIKTTGNK